MFVEGSAIGEASNEEQLELFQTVSCHDLCRHRAGVGKVKIQWASGLT